MPKADNTYQRRRFPRRRGKCCRECRRPNGSEGVGQRGRLPGMQPKQPGTEYKLRSPYSLLLCLTTCIVFLFYPLAAKGQTDTTVAKEKKPKEELGHLLRFGIDISR